MLLAVTACKMGAADQTDSLEERVLINPGSITKISTVSLDNEFRSNTAEEYSEVRLSCGNAIVLKGDVDTVAKRLGYSVSSPSM